ncbi:MULTISPECIES: hypothetical protein [unclassified Halomonas]|uniref:hypothetical protein n=1 Tax=unclassified Halomonas TaxID=2609666 RepID=UPI002076B24F|nr:MULTISPECIES: hypothetical protein [unclassified Halomonas]
MTTYEEISTSRRLNRAFWNQDCRFVIAQVREARRVNDARMESNHRRCLKSALKHRAEHTYLNAGL